MDVMKYLQAYSAQGWAIFPCSSADKSPLTPHGFLDASSDIGVIEKWYAKHPGCAWGYATSADVGVTDCDPRHGGDVTWAALVAEHGPLPETVTASTGGGGTHSFLVFPEGTGCSQSVVGKGIDVRADGGYVIVPPSRIHIPEHAKPYTWTVSPWAGEIAVAPDWLVALVAKPGKGTGTPRSAERSTATVAEVDPWVVRADYDLRTHPGAGIGQRRKVLCQCLRWHKDHGVGTDDDLYSWAGAWAQRTAALTGEPCEGWEVHVAGCLRRDAREHLFVAPVPVSGGGVSPPGKEPTNSRDTGTVSSFPDAAEPREGTNSDVPQGGVSSFLPGPEQPLPPGEPTPGGVSSFPDRSETTPPPNPQPDTRPDDGDDGKVLSGHAYHGVLGAVVKAVGPHTEADAPAILVALLACFGNAVGFNAHFNHGKVHGTNLFVGLVGDTSTRKGTATSIAKTVIAEADPEWAERVQHEGFGSGEGVIWAIRDASEHEPIGIADKRLMVIEEEWEKMFTLGASDKSILTPIIRGAYDRIPLGKRNKGDNAYGVKCPHISIVANITPTDLRKALTGRAAGAIANGFLNRFLLVKTVRSKYLPRGGQWKAKVQPYIKAIAEALAVAKTRSLMALDLAAEAVWDAEYEALETRPDGVAGDATARAADQVMKLALVYALADKAEAITVPHLRAGQAVWRYCEGTAVALFGGKVVAVEAPEPDPLWLTLLNAIEGQPGVMLSELVYASKNRGNAEAVGLALEGLRAKQMAHCVLVQNPGGGPRAERWYPGPGDGGGGEPESTGVPSPTPDPVSAEADAERPVVLPPESTKFLKVATLKGGVPTPGKEPTNSPLGGYLPDEGGCFPEPREGTNSPPATEPVSSFPADAEPREGTNSEVTGVTEGGVSSFPAAVGETPPPNPAGEVVAAVGALKCQASVNGNIIQVSPTDPDSVMSDEAFMRLLDHNTPKER